MRKQKQSEDLPIEYMEDEFIVPSKVNGRFVDYDMSKKEGKDILERSNEANKLSEEEKQLRLLQDLKTILGKKLSQAESEQYYGKPELILVV
jgi:hypothetical protein